LLERKRCSGSLKNGLLESKRKRWNVLPESGRRRSYSRQRPLQRPLVASSRLTSRS
jgi:hypothetical protein